MEELTSLEENPVGLWRKTASCEKGLTDAQLAQMQTNKKKGASVCPRLMVGLVSPCHSSRAQSGPLVLYPMEDREYVTQGQRNVCQLFLNFLLAQCDGIHL